MPVHSPPTAEVDAWMKLRSVAHRVPLMSLRTVIGPAALALLGLCAPAPATASAYTDYCSLHPHKSYCWDRHHHAPRKHDHRQPVVDLADCDQSNDPDRRIRGCTRLIEKDRRDTVASYNR